MRGEEKREGRQEKGGGRGEERRGEGQGGQRVQVELESDLEEAIPAEYLSLEKITQPPWSWENQILEWSQRRLLQFVKQSGDREGS